MSSLYMGSTLALSSSKRFVVATNDALRGSGFMREKILHSRFGFDPEQVCDIDLDQHLTGDMGISELDDAMCSVIGDESVYKSCIIWRNVQRLDVRQQKQLVKLLTMIDQHQIFRSRPQRLPPSDEYGASQHPKYFTIVLFVEYDLYADKIDPYLKEKFWFSVNCDLTNDEDMGEDTVNCREPEGCNEILSKIREIERKVHVSHDIQRYIYSLIIFVRTHRLSSLAPKNTRLHSGSLNSVESLCRVMVAWNNLDEERIFVTPETVKIAFRIVAYWQVDWEQGIFNSRSTRKDEELQKTQISMLSGDWYGSKWEKARNYLAESRSIRDNSTSTGFTNIIVEDALAQVRPPI